MHHKEGFRVVGVPHGEMAEGVEDAMVVENVQGINVSGEQLGAVCRSHYLVCGQQLIVEVRVWNKRGNQMLAQEVSAIRRHRGLRFP